MILPEDLQRNINFCPLLSDTASKDEKVIETKLQVSATNFKSWCLQHKMFVHLAKTSFMNIGTRQNLINIDNINIIIDNENISGVENKKTFRYNHR